MCDIVQNFEGRFLRPKYKKSLYEHGSPNSLSMYRTFWFGEVFYIRNVLMFHCLTDAQLFQRNIKCMLKNTANLANFNFEKNVYLKKTLMETFFEY